MRKSTRDLLKETFGSIPSTFAYREVRFYVYNALQKLEALEKRDAVKKKNLAEQEKKKDETKHSHPWMPPIYQNASQVQNTIDIIDRMIAVENKVIEDIHAAQNAKKVAPPKDDDEDDDIQTLHE